MNLRMVCIMSPAIPKHKEACEVMDNKEMEPIEIEDDSENADDMKIETLFGGSITEFKPLFSAKGE